MIVKSASDDHKLSVEVCDRESQQFVLIEWERLQLFDFWVVAQNCRNSERLFILLDTNDRIIADLDGAAIFEIKDVILNRSTE